MSSKWRSRKFWVTIWCCGLITVTVVLDRKDFSQLMTVLAAVPIAYIGCNTYQKNIDHNAGNDKKSTEM